MRSRCAGGRLFRTSDLMAGGNFLNAAQKATNKLVVIGGASIIVFLAACIAGVEALHLLQRARQTGEHARAALDLSGAFIVKPVAGDGLLDGGKFALDQALDARGDRGGLGGRLARRGGRNWCGVFHGLALRVGKRDAARAAAPAPLAQAREEGALGRCPSWRRCRQPPCGSARRGGGRRRTAPARPDAAELAWLFTRGTPPLMKNGDERRRDAPGGLIPHTAVKRSRPQDPVIERASLIQEDRL